MRASTTIAALIAALAVSVAAHGQAAAPAANERFTGWSAVAGYETFSLRDISRNTRPPDASPVSWRGAGPAVSARYERSRPRSAHLGLMSVARAGSFEYVSPLRSAAALGADSASRIEARYEYRRYFWRDAGIAGLNIGLGMQGIGNRLSLNRHMSALAATTTRIAGGGGAAVIAVNLQRWERLHLHGEWINGGVVSYRRTANTVDPLSARKVSGGSWLTDIVAGGAWRLTPGLRLSAEWRRSADGYSSSHFSYSAHRRSFTAGLVYAR